MKKQKVMDCDIEHIIAQTKASFEIEGFNLTLEDEERIRRCLAGESSFDEEAKKLIEKWRNR